MDEGLSHVKRSELIQTGRLNIESGYFFRYADSISPFF